MPLAVFAEKELGVQLWSKIIEIFDAVQNGKRKILIRSCNGAGKTCALAAICNWKLYTEPDSIVLTTASSHTQVRRNLWGEIRKQAKKGKLYGKGQLREALIKISEKHYAIGIAPSLPENAQGFHAPKMIIVIDEATGVSRDVIKALFGNATGDDAQIILAYNPINTDSYPYELEHNADWHQITISAFDHPNVIGTEPDNIKGAVSRKWIADMLPTWSYQVEKDLDDKHSFEFDGKFWRKTGEVSARVFGEWSEHGGVGFIPMHLVSRSVNLDFSGTDFSGTDFSPCGEDGRTKVRPTTIKSMGVDIAHGGDETVFAFFEGNTQLPFYSMRSKDLVEVAEKIKMYHAEGWKTIAIDDTGVGAGVSDILRSHGIDFFAVNFGSSSKKMFDTTYRRIGNTRAEIYFNLDDELKKSKIKLLDDRKLHQELTALRLRPQVNNDMYYLEPKEDLKNRLGRSPDRADATALARYAVKLKDKNNREYFR